MTLMLKIAGEIGTKSPRTRRRFLRVLVHNVRAALGRAGVTGVVEPRWSRVFVRSEEPGAARDALRRVFGVHSVSEVVTVPFSGLDDLVERAAGVFRDRVAGRTFGVSVKRSGPHPFASRDVAIALGTALLPASAGVDLDEPDVPVTLEIVDGEAYAVVRSGPGPGGLPLGTGHRALALFSGGFDSPVAAWMAMRRGTPLELLVFELQGCAQTDAALSVARELARWAPGVEPAAHVVDLAPVVASLRGEVASRIRQLLLKRAMYRAGTLVARSTGAEALVTGESLGQVSTQTLRNLAVAEEAAGVPVLRPLIGMDKEEIIERARAIGTHDASARVREHCAIARGRVETAARLREIVAAEEGLEESLVRAAVRDRRRVDLRAWTPPALPEHVVEAVPQGALVVDVREPEEGPTAGDVRLPFSRIGEWAPGLERGADYLFVCSHGVRSEVVARELAGRGYRARSLAGGIARLRIDAA